MTNASPRLKAPRRAGLVLLGAMLAAAPLLAPLLLALFLLSGSARAAAVSAAVFPFELDNTSPEASTPAEKARLAALDAQLRAALVASGRYAPVDIAPVASRLATDDLRTCDTCAADLARKLGAAVAVNGWVQKVSDLILNINLVVRDAASGKMLRAGSVDIRGNTDESWTRGLKYLLDHRILTASSP